MMYQNGQHSEEAAEEPDNIVANGGGGGAHVPFKPLLSITRRVSHCTCVPHTCCVIMPPPI